MSKKIIVISFSGQLIGQGAPRALPQIGNPALRRSMSLSAILSSSSKWLANLGVVAVLFCGIAICAYAEVPHAQLRTFAPGGIAIDWEHPNDGATSITLERENPAFTWVFVALSNSFSDLGLQPSRTYRH